MSRVRLGEVTARALAVGLIVVGGLSAVVAAIFPEGVNQSFAADVWGALLGLGLLSASLLNILGGKGGEDHRVENDADRSQTTRMLILVSLAPVIRYVVVNRSDVGLVSAIALLVGFGMVNALVVASVPSAFSKLANPRVLQVVITAWLFVILNMASLSAARDWHGSGSLWLQVLTLTAAVVVLLLLTSAPSQLLTWAVAMFLVLEVGNALIVGTESDANPAAGAKAPEASAIEPDSDSPWAVRPDIHLVVYESYASPSTIAAYGYDLTEHLELLEQEGFEVHPGTYSVAGNSLDTMSLVLQASSTPLVEPREITAGNSYATDVVTEQGYTTAGIFSSDYYYGLEPPEWDRNVPGTRSPWQPIVTSVLRGEFRADDSFNVVDYADYLEAKRDLLATSSGPPVFSYTHNRYPGHSQNSGQCRPNETELYMEKLERANEEMLADIEAANRGRRDAIVILHADHGPYLTKNCTLLDGDYSADEVDRLDLQDRYGTFLAIRWPESVTSDRQVRVLQDLVPIVFAAASSDERYATVSRVDPVTQDPKRTSGVLVENGVIRGGVNDGEPLFPGS